MQSLKGLRTTAFAAAGLVLAACASPQPRADNTADLDIPYEKKVLDNGLTVIVHEDHKAPVVAVNVWYHVGSKNEPDGKSGFAHLFEHLMFNGSENYNDEWFKPFERVGATGMNGTTNFDRTNYFEVVPKTAVDMALWMESDRMGHLLGAVDQAKLDEQRGVVQNEKRQGENRPYGEAFNVIIDNVFPDGHPYDHTTIGSMEDLNAASLDDVHQWFKDYYGASNATVVLAGDIEAEEAFAKAEKYFGEVPAGKPVDTPKGKVPNLDHASRVIHEDRVPQARIYKVWTAPGYGSAETDMLDITADVLADGKTSRLYKRLVYDDQIATDVSAFVWDNEVTSLVMLTATVKPDGDIKAVEAALDQELAKYLDEGPTTNELERIKAKNRSSFVRGLERVGGFGGKSDVLARNEVYLNNPDAWKTSQKRLLSATASEVHETARQWLGRDNFTLEIRPFPDYKAAEQGADRSSLPDVTEFPEADFPEVQRTTLSNGLEVVLAERHTIPVVNLSLRVNAGFAADQFGKPGTAKLAMDMLNEGTTTRSALDISEELDLLGAQLSTGSNVDQSLVGLSALKSNLAGSLGLFADVIRNPSFPEDEFERRRKQALANLQQEKNQPMTMALRVFPKQVYGDDHAYGQPLTGTGTRESITGITLDELDSFHDTWFRPNNATLVVAGDVTMEELKPLLEERFGGWKSAEVPEKTIPEVPLREGGTVYVVDRPDAEQSMIIAGHLAPPRKAEGEIALQAMNEVLGGSFNARLNMNLREDKGWSYGARTLVFGTAAQRPFVAYAPVQTDKTAESMAEIRREFEAIVGDEPPQPHEIQRAKDSKTKSLPGRWETISAVGGSLSEIVRYDLPDTYWDTYPEKVKSLDREAVIEAADRVVHPDRMVWVVVGDRDRIEDGIRGLGYEIRFVDADGDPVSE